jgi:hypothetical protein
MQECCHFTVHSGSFRTRSEIGMQETKQFQNILPSPASLHRRPVSSLSITQTSHIPIKQQDPGARAPRRRPCGVAPSGSDDGCRSLLASPPPHSRQSDRRPCGRGARGCAGPRACSPVRCSSADDGLGCWCSRSNARAPDQSRKGSRVRPVP